MANALTVTAPFVLRCAARRVTNGPCVAIKQTHQDHQQLPEGAELSSLL